MRFSSYPLVAQFPWPDRPGLQEVSVRNRIVQSVFLGAALFLVSVIPAAAQTDAFSAGLAFLSDSGGVGVRGRKKADEQRPGGWVL